MLASIRESDVRIPDGWRVVRLGDVAEVIGGSTPSRVVSEFWNGDIPWVVPTEVTNLKGRFLVSTTDTITSDGMRSAGIKMIPANSVLLTSRATIGAVAINKIPVSTNQGFQSLVPRRDVDTLWLYYLAGSMKRQLDRLAVGSTFREVHRSTMRKVQILLPPIDQQRKIAEVLDSIDDAIERTDGVIGATEQVRDALLYELLSRGMPGWHNEWRDVPGVGTLPASWDVVRLGDVAEVVTGGTPLRSCPDYYGGTTPWVKPTDLAKGNTVSTSEEYLTDDGVAVSRLLPQGAVLVSCIGTIGEVAIATIPMCTNQQINALVPNEKVVSSFLYWVCTSLSDFLRTSAAKTAVPILNKSSFSKVAIPLPSIGEQHAICRVLNSVDDSLECLRSERDSMQVLKISVADGLLTGRVRAPVVRD